MRQHLNNLKIHKQTHKQTNRHLELFSLVQRCMTLNGPLWSWVRKIGKIGEKAMALYGIEGENSRKGKQYILWENGDIWDHI